LVSFGFCLWQGGTRRPAIGDLRVMRRSEDAIQALRPSEPPPRAGGRNEEPQPPHGQGAHHDLLYGRGANLNSTTVETGRFSRRAMRHPARGTVAAAADVCCAAHGNFWQPTNHPIIRLYAFISSSPRHLGRPQQCGKGLHETPRQPHAPPCYPRAPLRSRPTRAHTHTIVVEKRRARVCRVWRVLRR